MRTMSVIAIAMTLIAAPAMTQEKHPEAGHDMMQMMAMMQGQGGMMAMDDGPSMILKLKESLELSNDQVQRLTTLQKSSHAAMQPHMMGAMHAMKAGEKLLGGTAPDLKAYETALRDAANHMVLARTGMAKADVEARQVLTAQQRDRLTLAGKIINEMKNGSDKGGMMKEGMKKDGMK